MLSPDQQAQEASPRTELPERCSRDPAGHRGHTPPTDPSSSLNPGRGTVSTPLFYTREHASPAQRGDSLKVTASGRGAAGTHRGVLGLRVGTHGGGRGGVEATPDPSTQHPTGCQKWALPHAAPDLPSGAERDAPRAPRDSGRGAARRRVTGHCRPARPLTCAGSTGGAIGPRGQQGRTRPPRGSRGLSRPSPRFHGDAGEAPRLRSPLRPDEPPGAHPHAPTRHVTAYAHPRHRKSRPRQWGPSNAPSCGTAFWVM